MGQFAHDQVYADCVAHLKGQDYVKDSQRTWCWFGFSHWFVFQPFWLVTRRVYPSHAIVRLGQHSFDLLIFVARQDSTKEVASI